MYIGSNHDYELTGDYYQDVIMLALALEEGLYPSEYAGYTEKEIAEIFRAHGLPESMVYHVWKRVMRDAALALEGDDEE